MEKCFRCKNACNGCVARSHEPLVEALFLMVLWKHAYLPGVLYHKDGRYVSMDGMDMGKKKPAFMQTSPICGKS